jgi:hypothetical protein
MFISRKNYNKNMAKAFENGSRRGRGNALLRLTMAKDAGGKVGALKRLGDELERMSHETSQGNQEHSDHN